MFNALVFKKNDTKGQQNNDAKIVLSDVYKFIFLFPFTYLLHNFLEWQVKLISTMQGSNKFTSQLKKLNNCSSTFNWAQLIKVCKLLPLKKTPHTINCQLSNCKTIKPLFF